MSDDPPIHQIECRWREHHDFSPIAASFDKQIRDDWFSKLKTNVRPPQRPGMAGIPMISAVYRTFPDGTAAFIWRQYDDSAKKLDDTGNRRPLVARILVGSWGVLNPAVAIALCRGWEGLVTRATLGTRPGQVDIDQSLREIDCKELGEVRKDGSVRLSLDIDARKELGLERLVAAVLRESASVALNVQLPPAVMGDPGNGPQVRLLHGSLVISWHLLHGLDASAVAMERWSFSTYELPLGGSETDTLPQIVFRDKPADAPSVTRPETTVSPRGSQAPYHVDDFDETAAILVRAYQEMHLDVLEARLTEIRRSGSTLEDRMAKVRTEFPARVAAPRRVEPSPAEPPAEPPDQPDIGAAEFPVVGGVAGGGVATMPGGLASGSIPTAPTIPGSLLGGDAAGSPSSTASVTNQHRPVGGGAQQAARSGQGGRHAASSAGSPPAIVQIIRDLAQAQTPEGVAVVMEQLEAAGTPQPDDRALARDELLESDWCFKALNTNAPYAMHAYLERLFRATVIPDLSQSDVQRDLAAWAYSRWARPMVMKALYTAARNDGPEAHNLMNIAVLEALGWRWMDEHDIFVTQPEVPSGPEAPSKGSPGDASKGIWSIARSPIVIVTTIAILFFILFIVAVILKW